MKVFKSLVTLLLVAVIGISCVACGEKTTQYTVSFKAEGTEVSSVLVDEGKTVAEPTAPTLSANKRFEGWFEDEAFTDEWNFTTDTVTKDTILYAGYTEYFTVTFSAEGQTVGTQEVDKGEKATAPSDPTDLEPGMEFTGWYKEESLTTPWDFATDTVTANVTLYAGIEEVPYDIAIVTDSRLIENTDANVKADYQLMGYTDSLMVGVGGGLDYSYQLSASITEVADATFTYQSSDTSVVTVSETGLVEFVSAGKATIYVTCTDGLAKIAVTVFAEAGYKNFFEGDEQNYEVIDESQHRADLFPDTGANDANYRSYIGNKQDAMFQFNPLSGHTDNKSVDIKMKKATNIAMIRFVTETKDHITPTIKIYGYNQADASDITLIKEVDSVVAETVSMVHGDFGSYQMDLSEVLSSTATYEYFRIEFVGATQWWQPSIKFLEIYTA